jgi:SAM-dependent methyltransferase
MSSPRREVFERIYATHLWAGTSRSGPGSDPEHTIQYVRFVSDWLASHSDARRVVELGCGDWATSQLITFMPSHTYLGLDIVPAAIDSNRRRFGRPNVRFECCDFLSQRPRSGDVLLIKDVLQHLSNQNVKDFLERILPRFRYAIITNDAARYEEKRFCGIVVSRKPLAQANVDVVDGGSRPLRLEDVPFNLEIAARFSYAVVLRKGDPRVVYVKNLLVWRNSQPVNPDTEESQNNE